MKLIDIFKLFLKNTSENNSTYLFDWIRKCIKDPSVDKVELTEEITRNIDRLVAWDKEKVREVVMKLPNIGQKLINALEYTVFIQGFSRSAAELLRKDYGSWSTARRRSQRQFETQILIIDVPAET